MKIPKRLKILFLVSSFPSFDDERSGIFNFNTYNQLIKLVDVEVVVIRSWRPNRQKSYNYNGVPVTVLPVLNIPYSNKYIPFSSNTSVQNISNFFACCFVKDRLSNILCQIDLIHSVEIGLPTLIGNKWKKKYHIPHITQAIGSDVNYYLPKMKNQSSFKNWESTVSAIICNSQALSNSLNLLNSNLPDVYVRYRGVNLSKFNNLGKLYPNKDNSEITFLYIGGDVGGTISEIGNSKGAKTMLDAWHMLISSTSLNNATLFFGGPNSKNNKIIKHINNLRNPKSVKLLGLLSPSDLIKLYKQVDVVVIPSKNEGLPNVLLEAMSTGCLVVANNVGGIPEVINSGINGILNIENSAEGLFKILHRILENVFIIKNYGEAARQTVEEKFDSSNYGFQISEIYKTIIKYEVSVSDL